MNLKNRVKELRMVKASDLSKHPSNFRTHSKAQRDALDSILSEIGFAGAILTRELPNGKLQILDGHLRSEEVGKNKVPALVTDLTEEEAKLLIATYDPIGAMAGANAEKLATLLDEVTVRDQRARAFLDSRRPRNEEGTIDPLPTDPPPKMVWVLVGIPLDRYGDAHRHVAALEKISDISVQATR